MSGFGRLYWEGLAVCLTGSCVLLSSVRLVLLREAVGEGVALGEENRSGIGGLVDWTCMVCL